MAKSEVVGVGVGGGAARRSDVVCGGGSGRLLAARFRRADVSSGNSLLFGRSER